MKKECKLKGWKLNWRTWHLIDEAYWLIQLVCTIFLAISLITYNPNDPCWTVMTNIRKIHNYGGWLGAMLADCFYFLWGGSTFWMLIAMMRHTLLMFFRLIFHGHIPLNLDMLEHEKSKSTPEPKFYFFMLLFFLWNKIFSVKFFAFLLLLFVSSILESLRFWSVFYDRYDVPGGVFGDFIGQILLYLFGFTGATMFLLALVFISLSLWWNFSWLDVVEVLGKWIVVTSVYIKNKCVLIYNYCTCIYDTTNYHNNQSEEFVKVVNKESMVSINHDQNDHDVEDFSAKFSMSDYKDTTSNECDVADNVLISEDEVKSNSEPFLSPKKNFQAKYQDVLSESENNHHNINHVESLPSLDLLDKPSVMQERIAPETLTFTKQLIAKKLKEFGVAVKVHDAWTGPIVTRYEIEPDVGIKGSQIVNLAKDLARSFSLTSIRVVETIPGKNLMALELPNTRRQIVKLSEILTSEVYQLATSPLTICLGKDIAGMPFCADLAKMPHLLVAGTTGSGKSVGINAMILSLLYKASARKVRMILIDPKMLELSVYEGIPHLLCPVVTDMSQSVHALNWAIGEMERRYKLMSKLGVRNLDGFNTKIDDAYNSGNPILDPMTLNAELACTLEILPAIVIVIDELADLVMVIGRKIEELIARIAQKARAAGIHLILATQRPSVDVITGLIKANIPTRIAFQVSSKIDSRTILDQQGADTLLGMGDMLYLPPGSGMPLRVHGAFVSDEEVSRVVENLRKAGPPNYVDGILNGAAVVNCADDGLSSCIAQENIDPLYDQAVEIVLKYRRASISLVQRQLRIGYNRAARLLEQMENEQIVSPMTANGNREILIATPEKI